MYSTAFSLTRTRSPLSLSQPSFPHVYVHVYTLIALFLLSPSVYICSSHSLVALPLLACITVSRIALYMYLS